MDDIRAVLDAVGSERAVVVAPTSTGPVGMTFAATYPERTAGLVLFNCAARYLRASDYPYGPTREEADAWLRSIRTEYEDGTFHRRIAETLGVDGDDWERTLRSYGLTSASPSAFVAHQRLLLDTDVRDVLPAIRVPTLVLFRGGLGIAAAALGERARERVVDVAARIPGAEMRELGGRGNSIWANECSTDEIERFVQTLDLSAPEPETVLATVLFTDLVGSTDRAALVGDRAWRDELARHHALVRGKLAQFKGVEQDTAGDGFFATFDGPARAIRCAMAIVEGLGELGLDVRAGVHTGECELFDRKVTGIAVAIGARVASKARPGEVLVSQTVRDLVAGSELEFAEEGEHRLKGVPGTWRLYTVA
jgi:class 3 adenylate cyclase